MKLLRPFSLIEKFCRFLENIPNFLLSGAGGLVLAMSLVAGAMIERKDLAVAVAIAGTFIGTALLSFFLPKLLYTLKKDEIEKAALANQKLIEDQRQKSEVERRLTAAIQEIARLEKMQINLDSFNSVLRLGLLNVNMHITDWCRRRLGRTERAVPFLKDYNSVYLGVLKLPIRATLGIDLEKVCLKEDKEGKLIVSNIIPCHDIHTLKGVVWLEREVRKEYFTPETIDGVIVDKVVEVTSDPADATCMKLSTEHDEQVRGRVEVGQDFTEYQPAIIKAAENFLRTLLTPLNKEIVFSKDLSSEGDQILTFLKKHNSRLQSTIEERRKQISMP